VKGSVVGGGSGGRRHAHCPAIDREMTARTLSGSWLLLALAALKSVAAVAAYSTADVHRSTFQRDQHSLRVGVWV